MRFNFRLPARMAPVDRWTIVVSNLALFLLSLVVIEINLTRATESKEINEAPFEARLPLLTMTDAIETDYFFKNLSVDMSKIDKKGITDCISPWESFIKKYSSQYKVDPDLISALIYTESKGNPYCVSRQGALGLMQIMPTTADFLGITNILDPEENIRAGVKYISWLTNHYDERYILWAWNAGPNMIEKKRISSETKDFIIKVLSIKTFITDQKNKNNLS